MPTYLVKVRCPKCEWEPDHNARWACSCSCLWNTFDTHGKCPKCGKVWKNTQCLACHQWSPHVDWYMDWPSISTETEEMKKATD